MSNVTQSLVNGAAQAIGASLAAKYVVPPLLDATDETARKTKEVADRHANACRLAVVPTIAGGVLGGPGGAAAGAAIGASIGHSVDRDVQKAKQDGTYKEGDPGFDSCAIQ